MQLRIALGIAAGLYATLWVQLAAADTLNITLDNFAKTEGMVMLQIFASEDEFNDDQPAVASIMRRLQTVQGAPEARNLSIAFSIQLAKGEYGIRVMHDVNSNGKLDANFVGMPTEPWAFSNNATGNFGPPKWPDVKFELNGEAQQNISLQH